MEQRIKALEEEVKLLKNEIKSVLLDIKESLAGGEWVMTEQSGLGEKGETAKVEEITQENEPVYPAATAKKAGEISEDLPIEGIRSHTTGKGEERTQLRGSDRERMGSRASGVGRRGGIDILTLMRLIGWLEKSRQEIGRDETENLVKVYADSDNVQEEDGQALQLVNGIWGSEEQGTLLDSLMELDKIMRQQGDSRHLQSMLVKMITDKPVKGQGDLKTNRERMDRIANG